MKKPLKIPKFKNLQEEREFWDKVDIGDYFDADDFERVIFPDLKPTTQPVSIRFPRYVIDAVKRKANAQGVPYQALIKQAVAQKYILHDSSNGTYKRIKSSKST